MGEARLATTKRDRAFWGTQVFNKELLDTVGVVGWELVHSLNKNIDDVLISKNQQTLCDVGANGYPSLCESLAKRFFV